MKLKVQLLLAAVAVTVCSCNLQREACYMGKAAPSHENTQFGVAASASAIQPGQHGTVATPSLEEAQPVNVSDAEACAESVVEEPVFFAMVPQEATGNEGISITTVMAKELRAAAVTIDNRFAQRMINRSANRMEKMGFETNHKVTVFDKARAKISEKFFEAYAARQGASNILAIVSLVSGIVAFAWYAAFPFGVAAIVLGAVALAKGTDRRGMAIAGIVLGAIAIAFWSGWIITV